MISLATHMRITNLNVGNDQVDAFKAAVGSLRATWAKVRNMDEILARSAMVAQALGGDGKPDHRLGEEVQAAVQERASAFVYAESPLDVGVVAGAVVAELMSQPMSDTGSQVADIWAAATWSALSFQPVLTEARREALRVDVMKRARERTIVSAETARLRRTVEDVELPEGEDAEEHAKALAAVKASLVALRRNAALDREELDFLWWSQSERSRLLEIPFSSLGEAVRVVACGIEASSHLRRLPCDVHREVVLRTIDGDLVLDLPGLLAVLGEDRARLVASYEVVARREPLVFPLLHALATGSSDAVGAAIGRPVSEWGARALLEGGLAGYRQTGPKTL